MLDTILELALIHEEYKNVQTGSTPLYEQYSSQLFCVKDIKRILSNQEDTYSLYQHQDSTQIKVNFLLAIASYLDFEVKNQTQSSHFNDWLLNGFPNILYDENQEGESSISQYFTAYLGEADANHFKD